MGDVIDIQDYQIQKANNRLEPIVDACRRKILTSAENEIIIGNTVIGYEYLQGGGCHRYYLEGSLNNIASFILSSVNHKLITSVDDFAIINTKGTCVDLCVDPAYHIALLHEIQSLRHSSDSLFDFL